MRVQRIVDAAIFFIALLEAYKVYGTQPQALLVCAMYVLSIIVQTSVFAATLMFPMVCQQWHEYVKVLCQLNNFITQITVTLALTSLGAKYPLRHSINTMMCAINCLPGQVRISTMTPILAAESMVWVLVGAIQRQHNPLHSAPPITTLWQLLLHIAVTYFMSFGVIVVLGLLLELRSRRCFLMSTKCGELQWQPSGFAALLFDTVNAIMSPFSAVPAAKQCSSAEECSSSSGATRSCCRPSEAINAASSGSPCCSSSSTARPSAVPSAPGCCSGQSSAAGGGEMGNGSGLPPTKPCGVQSIEQVEACQRLLDDRNKLAKKQRSLQQKLELLETEVGRDTLEVMGERSRAQSLAQQVANMTQQLAAQRCVATFLGSNEKVLREEIVNLQKERNELAEEAQRARVAAKRIAAEKVELLEKLERAVHLMEHMRVHTQAEKTAMWGGLLRALQLTQPPPSIDEAASAVIGRLKELGWPVSPGLAAWLEEAVCKEEQRQHTMPLVHTSPLHAPESTTSSSASRPFSEAGSRRSSGDSAVPTATPRGLQEDALIGPVAWNVLPPSVLSDGGVGPSSGVPASAALPASVLARLPSAQGMRLRPGGEPAGRPSTGGPAAAAAAPGARREERRSTSLESESLSGRFSSFGSDAELDRYSSISSVESQCDAQPASSQSRGSAGRDCGVCTGRVHQPVLDAVSARVLTLSSGPAMAGPEWTHLFAAKCHQEEKWAGLLADALHLTESMARERLDTEKKALRTVLNISEEGVAHAPPRPCMSCQAAAHKLAESEAEHAGMRGAAVAALRHLTGQQRRLREAIGGLVPVLAAGDPSEAPQADLELRLAVAARLRQLAQPPPQMATSGRLLDGLLGAVPTAAEIGDVLSSAESSQAEKSMGAWLETITTWLHSMETINDDVLPQGCCEGCPCNPDAALQRVEGALHVVVGRLVDRAFATQSAVVHFAHSVARQAHTLSAANQQLRELRRNERRMLDVLMTDRQKLLANVAALRCCTESAVCARCRQPMTERSSASSAAA
ncbi:g7947 [Coccomyxa elongata]